jgi:MYXO-CTERM domain-containing protein
MKAVTARVRRKNFFVIFLGLLSAFSLGSSVWPYSVTQNQNCSGNCESHERLAAFTQTKTLDARTVSFTPADRISALQSADLATGADVQSATSGSTTDQVPTSTQALKNSGTEGGSTPGPGFFLLVGLALIGVRLVISYRSRKVKNLATQTH